jgi:4-amino-4-deoxy-L-arabinose transferase-like glycosyltransferase
MGLATPLFLWSRGIQSLNGCDESFYAQMAREMFTSGDWLSPRFLGDLFFEKPPLLVWLITLSYQVAGVNVWAARLPGILSALLCIPLVGWIGRQFLSFRAAALGMVVLPLSYLWVQQGRLVGQDIPLTALELLGIAALITGIQGQPLGFWIMGLALGLGLLMKSAMILLVGVALIPFLVAQTRINILLKPSWLRSPHFWGGLLAGVSLFFLWVAASIRLHGSMVWHSLIGKVVDLGREGFHASNTWSYYLWHIPAHGFPWTVLALLGLLLLLRGQPSRNVLIWSLPLTLFLELQFFATRTHYYTVQLYPWLALLAGVTLDQAMNRWSERGMDLRSQVQLAQWLSWGLAVVGLLVLGVGLAVVAGVTPLQMLAGHGLALVLVGILYLFLPLIWTWRRVVHHAAWIWLVFLLLASVITLGSIIHRPDFGNANPPLAQLQQQWSDYLPRDTPVDICRSGVADVCQAQAHVFYTPTPGTWVDDQKLIAGDFSTHLWLSPVQAEQFPWVLERFNLEPVLELNGWQLCQRTRSPGQLSIPIQ